MNDRARLRPPLDLRAIGRTSRFAEPNMLVPLNAHFDQRAVRPSRRQRVPKIVQLIAAAITDTGLKVRTELDENKYPEGVKVSDAQIAAINLSGHTFHGHWNYTIATRDKVLARTRK